MFSTKHTSISQSARRRLKTGNASDKEIIILDYNKNMGGHRWQYATSYCFMF